MKVFIDGATYNAHFLLRGDSVKLPVPEQSRHGANDHNSQLWSDKQSVLLSMRVGVDYLQAAYQETAQIKPAEVWTDSNSFSEPNRRKLFEIRTSKVGVPDHERFGETLPYLDVSDEGSSAVFPPLAEPAAANEPLILRGKVTSEDLLIERIAGGELLQHERDDLLTPTSLDSREKSKASCRVHIQIGRGDLRRHFPMVEAKDVRCVIVTLRELTGDKRIRKSISYESIIVDILRLLRKNFPNPEYSQLFNSITGGNQGKTRANDPKQLFLIVRINHAAVLVYQRQMRDNFAASDSADEVSAVEVQNDAQKEGSSFTEGAHLFFHQRHPAPMDDLKLGRVDGFSGFLAVNLAQKAKRFYENPSFNSDGEGNLPDWIKEGISTGILWQVAQNRRGALKLFFFDTSLDTSSNSPRSEESHPERMHSSDTSEDPRISQPRIPRSKALWEPILHPRWDNRRRGYFQELKRCLENEEKWNDNDLTESLKRVRVIKVRVGNAVSHRTQWFLAGDHLMEQSNVNPSPPEFESKFTEVAKRWLTLPQSQPESDPEKTLPLVTIGNLLLMDRREVEDYLALRDAIRNYEKSETSKPLNLAVFGAPGAGKSFGVTQVVTHAAARGGSKLNPETLSFNVSQFTSLHDLVTALHLVRNECLKGKIPVVFFDEFDSAFEGHSFGWLKYFLAPMQDGEFTDGGRIFRLGRSVIVFAGGVNRSFEEINGRLRNPGFVDAKGPDFISRLRGHMNIRGINKPEDDVDQSRYILRRAIMLHGMLARRLNPRAGNDRVEGLLEPSVAHAFCGIAAFKHGARSMEAILDMCDVQRGRRLGPSDLPAKAQLEMHVDASEFMDLIFRYPLP